MMEVWLKLFLLCVPKGAENYQKIQYRITQMSHKMLLKCIYTGFAAFFQSLKKMSREVGNLHVPLRFTGMGYGISFSNIFVN